MGNTTALIGIEKRALGLFMSKQCRGFAGQPAVPLVCLFVYSRDRWPPQFQPFQDASRSRTVDQIRLRHDVTRSAAIDQNAACRLFAGKSPVSLTQLFVKFDQFSFEPVGRILPSPALSRGPTPLEQGHPE